MKRFLCLFLAITLICSTGAFAFGAHGAEMHNVKIQGTYHQTHARTLLSKVNAFRTGSNAWAWNSTNTAKIKYTRSALKYDYELEELAMQRAAEIAVYYGAYLREDNTQDHKRPNGKKWDSIHTIYNPSTGYAIGENLLLALKSDVQENPYYAYQEWLEENQPYIYQSHRRNMLGVSYDFVSTAFACFEIDEIYYYVQLFRGTKVINSTPTTVSETPVYKTVELSSNFVKSFALSDAKTDYTLNIGDTLTLQPLAEMVSIMPMVQEVNETTGEVRDAPTALSVQCNFTSSRPSVVSVSGTKLTACGAGSAIITASLYGARLQYTITVSPTDISNAVISLDKYNDTYIYTGSPILPQITVSLGDVVLTDADYSVTYADNVEVGNAKLVVTGHGNYTGMLTKFFFIINKEDCQHRFVVDAAVPATCTHKAMTPGTHCVICGEVGVEQEEYGELAPHTPMYVPQVDSTCSKTGYTAWSYCAVCGVTITAGQQIATKPHTPVIDAAKEPNCTEKGKTEGSHCKVCAATITAQQDIEPLGHLWSTQAILQKASLTADGKIYRKCTRDDCSGINTERIIYYPKTYTLSKASFVYTGKAQKPVLSIKDRAGKLIPTSQYSCSIPNGKNVGRYKITVVFKGNYSGTKYLYYDILPKNTSKFALTAAKKAFKVKWTTQKVQTKGYQVQYSLYSNFKSATAFTLSNNKYNAATVSKLVGGKRYYVRIRTYQTVKYNGKNINLFSPWSGSKSVVVKK